ncbi:MAG: helix-turn-helix domain-containing protein [bacterium]|nr:helix-turn-helix domain-containing protein [bacterium]
MSQEKRRPVDLTIKQTMAELAVSRDTVNRLIRRGELAAYDISANPQAKRRTLRVRCASVLEFKERRAVKSRVSLETILRDL